MVSGGGAGNQLPRFRRYRRSNMTYTYSATQNNGRIVSSADGVTGENVSYTYDSLNRLIAAATSVTTRVQWGDSYSYDGFGNLTSKVVTKGTAPQVYPQVNSATNQARMSGDYGFDANGNWLGSGGNQINTWNVENQLISTGGSPSNGAPTYTYDPWGKRVLQYSDARTYGAGGTLYFYSITGQRLGTYQVSYLCSNDPPLQQSVSMYFGRRMLAPVDRLGSVRSNANGHGPIAYYPWGEERTSTPDGTDKFATYFRDVSPGNGVGQDYANARYYNNNFGRFWSPDPAGMTSVDARNPISWNGYTYVWADPINAADPTGRCVIANCLAFQAKQRDQSGAPEGSQEREIDDDDECRNQRHDGYCCGTGRDGGAGEGQLEAGGQAEEERAQEPEKGDRRLVMR